MAWKDSASVGNATQGPVGGALQGIPQGIYEQSSTQKGPLGTRIVLPDSRAYRYSHFVAAVNAGELVAQDESVSSIAVSDGKMTAAAIGVTQVTFTDNSLITTADVKDVYAGGYLHTEDDAGEAYTYRIKGNDAGEASGTDGELVMDLYDGLVVALTTATDVSVTGNLWKNLKIGVAGSDCVIAGVAVRAMTIAYYGWVQTWGPASCLAEATTAVLVKGRPAFFDGGVAGAASGLAGVASNTTLNAGDWDGTYLGEIMHTGTDAAHVAINLKLYP